MDTMNNDAPNIITPLGLALHNARLKASLSVEQVAKLLNLKESAVRELEGDISDLIESGHYAPIYLRGYLANYAKLVALKSIDEFAEYQQLSKPESRDTPIRPTASMFPAGKKKIIPRWLLVFLLLIAILAVVFAKQFDFFSAAEPAAEATAESSEHVENKPFNPVALNTETAPELKQEKSADALDEVIDQGIDEGINEGIDEVSDAAIPSKTDQSSNADIIKSEDKSAGLESTEPLVQPQTAQTESLQLSFTGDCWTEVSDATGKRLAYGLYGASNILKLDGMAPFKIKLGDPSAVAIKYQDKRIDRDFTAGQAMEFYIPA